MGSGLVGSAFGFVRVARIALLVESIQNDQTPRPQIKPEAHLYSISLFL